MQFRQRVRRIHHRIHIKRQRIRRLTYFTQTHQESLGSLPQSAPSGSKRR